jgi:outer membrane biosynthesis protein TonB
MNTASRMMLLLVALTFVNHQSFAQEATASASSSASTDLLETPMVNTSSIAYVEPKFPVSTGFASINQFIAQRIAYPEAATRAGVSGALVVKFEITPEGDLVNYTFVKSPMSDFEVAVSNVLDSMPRWTPAYRDGHAVTSVYELRLNFRLQ